MIIDAHAHIFPEKIAEKASVNIGKFYDIDMHFNGTVDTMIEKGARCGVTRFLVHSVATTPEQVDKINAFIVAQVRRLPDQLIGFATLHPDSDQIERQVDWAIAHGLRGIKLHPDFQKFYLDSERAMHIFRTIEGRLPVLIHTGDYRTEYSKPARLVRVLHACPKLDVIAAHFGGWSEWESGALALATEDVYVDTSSSQYALKPHQVRELIDIFGPDRVLFGSDYPMWDCKDELAMLAKIPMSEQEREMIYHRNLEKLLEKYAHTR